MPRRALITVIALAAWCAACGPRPPPAPPRQTSLGLAIASFAHAPSGLRVVVVPDPRAAEVQVLMRYQVGAVDDPAGHAGMAHLVEHLMFQQRAAGAGAAGATLFARFEAAAAWFNAYTELDTTTFVSRGSPSRLAELLALEAARLAGGCHGLTSEAFSRERDVVVNELRENAAGVRTSEALYGALYPAAHPFRRSVGGTADSVAGISQAQACAFIAAHYAPDNAVLVVSGPATRAQVAAALATALQPAEVPRGALRSFVQLGPAARSAMRRALAGRPAVPALTGAPHAAVAAHVDSPVVVLAWPLPRDPATRAELRALAGMVEARVDRAVDGRVSVRELGGERGAVIALVIDPDVDETPAEAIAAAARAIETAPAAFDPTTFEQARQLAVYRLFARFEDGPARDAALADHVLAGRDPAAAARAEIAGIEALTAGRARSLVRAHLAFPAAAVIQLLPSAAIEPPGSPAAPAPADADAGATIAAHAIAGPLHAASRQPPANPADALRPAPRTTDGDPLAAARSYTLRNGLHVILMPLTSVPTVDLRLVFNAGTADEPATQRGVALVAGHALAAPAARTRDIGPAASRVEVEVDKDHTTFRVRGLDMHLDLLLTGLDRLVRTGAIDDGLRYAATPADPDDDVLDAWRAALFGDDHPYTQAGIWRHANFAALDRRTITAFRDAHYRPTGATLIIAGGFDPALAARWVNHVFGSWRGAARPRRNPPATLNPIALARHADTPQLAVDIALPLSPAARAANLIAAEMIRATVADVRHQLGATYGLDATLTESRLATELSISGLVDLDRAPTALRFIRDRLAHLATADAATASVFVAARRRVIAQLSSVSSGAASLAALAESSVDLGRPLALNRATAEHVRQLTLPALAPILSQVALDRAAILLRGPAPIVTATYRAIDRVPRVLD